jgi:RNA polymerase sigma-70 factor, ECF subfamily
MEEGLIDSIRNGNEEAFEELFRAWHPKLCLFAHQYVGSADISRDVVQEVFIRIWDQHEVFEVHYSLKAYLYRAVKNQAISYLRTTRKDAEISDAIGSTSDRYMLDENNLFKYKSLADEIWREVEKLPERKRTIFTLYRKHGLSYKEIATVMDISRKTVENQMGRALHFLRERLQAYHSDKPE